MDQNATEYSYTQDGVVKQYIYIYIYIYYACVCVCVCTRAQACACVHAVFVDPCHNGMARPQVADGGTASNMESSYE